MGVKLVSASAGSVELVASATASNYTATMPAATGTIVLDSATQTLTNKTISGAVMQSMASSVITSGTAVASTSGTSIDFTGIPSWVKRITVMFSGVSTSGTSIVQVQLGDSGGVETSGYTGSVFTTNTANALHSSGFALRANAFTAADTVQGLITLALLDPTNNTWVCQGATSKGTSADTSVVSGSKALSGTLDRVRITTVNGTDTFDAGSINILYE